MPTKHIDDELWASVVQKTVETIVETKTMVKETEILQRIVQKGIEVITPDELAEFAHTKVKHKQRGEK